MSREPMTDKPDSSLARMLSVLDLFSDQRLHWSAEDISAALGVSLPTSYRYMKTLSDAGLPTDWAGFRRYYSTIRKDGHYFSNGELEANLAAIAVPLRQADGAALGALSVVTTVQRMAVIDRSKLTPLVQRAAQEIAARLQ